jgi:Ferritin-like domain
MTVHDAPAGVTETAAPSSAEHELQTLWRRVVGRRSFLKQAGIAGAAAMPAGALLTSAAAAKSSGPTAGDVAILRFLAAAEILETDLWQQYAELGGANGGNAAYIKALENLDGDMPQYISDNTDDELSHELFINAYLLSKGAQPVNLERFRTLRGSEATGADRRRRWLTNLKELDVDTSWYTRYRSGDNPDFGATFPQAVTIHNQPAIPLSDRDTPPNQDQPVPPVNARQSRMQAIANSAGFHFAMIEQGGSSLYVTLAQQVTNVEVLRIVLSIGGVEVNHFAVWHDKAGNAVAEPLAGVTDPETHTHFPNLNASGGEATQTNLIFPEPCDFISKDLPQVSIIRPSSTANSGAMAAVRGLTADGLFKGQSAEFFTVVSRLAREADAAVRGV